MMGLEDFKNLAAGIQSLLVGLAVLIGGGWALFRFFSLREVKKATAELEKMKRDLQQRGHLQIEMKASQIFSSDYIEKYINVSLLISNVGNRSEVIRWLDSKFSASPVSRGVNGEVKLGEPIWAQVYSQHFKLEASTIDPGTSESYALLIPVGSDGVYLLEASLAGSPAEMDAAIEKMVSAGVERPTLAYWGSGMYFRVVDHYG